MSIIFIDFIERNLYTIDMRYENIMLPVTKSERQYYVAWVGSTLFYSIDAIHLKYMIIKNTIL